MNNDKDNTPPENDLGLSMIDTIRSSQLSNVAEDLAEVGLDALINDSTFRDIPIIGSIVGVTKAIASIKDKILARKIYSFLVELKKIPANKRKKFLDNMENNPDFKRKVGENLIMLLDRLDDLDKPALVAKIFKAYVQNDINYHQFLRFESVIDRVLIKDLQNLLKEISNQSSAVNAFAEYLYPLGLSKLSFDEDMFVKAGSGSKEIRHSQKVKLFPSRNALQFKLSKMAYLLAQILLDKKIGNTDYIAENRMEIEKIKVEVEN